MRLRKLQKKDAERMLSWMHAEETKELFLADFANTTLEDAMAFIEKTQNDLENYHFACVDDDDQYLGTVSLKNIDVTAGTAEYAISFCKDAQGTGAAAFATREITRYAFEQYGLNKVYLNVLSDNERANKFYKKMGFIYEGTFEQHLFLNNKYRDLNWYRILKSEWQTGGTKIRL